jgi:hypothetical protein
LLFGSVVTRRHTWDLFLLALAGGWAEGVPQAYVTESLSIVIRREDFRTRESNHNVLGAVKALTPLRATETIKAAVRNGAFLPFLPRLLTRYLQGAKKISPLGDDQELFAEKSPTPSQP